ncbi:alpha/beta fold hydrolase [Streptomyces sp. NPDC001985]|uniref:alpha/beta fold hydrolase n=1 Tax=Streptomyces sp. NPDC001985 TaxID=3154406 RepID=UPI003330EE67
MTLTHDLAGSGPVAVLLHSTVCDRRMWDPQLPALTEAGLRVVRPDFRGYGETPAATAPYTDAGDVLALLNTLGIERAALVGSSYGGRVALEIAAREPDRVTALALLCPGLPDQGESPRLAAFDEAETALFEAGDLERAAALNAETWLGPEAGEATREAVRRMQLHAFRVQSAAAEEYGGDTDFDVSALTAVRAPALVLSGAHDLPDFRATAARLPRLLPRARHRELPWAGHLPGLERPAEINGALTEFLTEHARPCMSARDVHLLLDLFAGAGVRVWVDGGWGVDALLGEQTRPHQDLDIAVDRLDFARLRAALTDAGFTHVLHDGPFNEVLADPGGRHVDIHQVDFATTRRDGAGTEIHGPLGLAYPVGSLTATGTVLGRTVDCMSAASQIASHTGYAIDEDDLRDVLALHRRFGLPLLPAHEEFLSRAG